MLLSIHLCFLFSFLVYASPLHHARGEYNSPNRRSRQLSSPTNEDYVKRERSALSSASPGSTPTGLTLGDDDSNDDGDRSDNEDDSLIHDNNDSSDEDSTKDMMAEGHGKIEQSTKSGDVAMTEDTLSTQDAASLEVDSSSIGDYSPEEEPNVKNLVDNFSSSEKLNSNFTVAKGLSKGSHPIIRASFTSNPNCGQSVSCNAGKNDDHTGIKGIGATAVNKMLFGGPPGVFDGSGGFQNVNGLGGACGSCWTLSPGFNYYESNGIPLGETVVVRINDECTDPGYCDQTPDHPLNTGPLDGIQSSGKFEAPVHFDLCEATDVAKAFFGELKTGVAMGAAQYNPDCIGLEDGDFGGKTVGKLAMPF
ncbi:MAG: hypothetical protein Q9169_004924 [Polycauliona sp. 2 TL-2023]